MKLWMGGESQMDVFDMLRDARVPVVKEINKILETREYNIPLNGLDVITILRDDDEFEEVCLYSPLESEMDYRLKLPFTQFKESSPEIQKSLILKLILRAVTIIKKRHIQSSALDDMFRDIAQVGRDMGWV